MVAFAVNVAEIDVVVALVGLRRSQNGSDHRLGHLSVVVGSLLASVVATVLVALRSVNVPYPIVAEEHRLVGIDLRTHLVADRKRLVEVDHYRRETAETADQIRCAS